MLVSPQYQQPLWGQLWETDMHCIIRVDVSPHPDGLLPVVIAVYWPQHGHQGTCFFWAPKSTQRRTPSRSFSLPILAAKTPLQRKHGWMVGNDGFNWLERESRLMNLTVS